MRMADQFKGTLKSDSVLRFKVLETMLIEFYNVFLNIILLPMKHTSGIRSTLKMLILIRRQNPDQIHG